MSAGPPPLVRRLLAWVLPPGGVRDGLLGDLDELYAERARSGRASASLWYARQVFSAALHYLPRRLGAGGAHGEGTGMMEGLGRDLGYAFRTLARRPGFTAVIVLTLALGIGANTAVFSVVRSVLLRPLPYPEDERLASLLIRMPMFELEDVSSSTPEYVAYRDQMESWEHLAAHRVRLGTVTEDGEEPERLEVAFATWNLFPMLRSEPLLGRVFTAEEDREGSDGVAVLNHAYWTSRYGGDPRVLGKTVHVDGVPRTIVGIMPADFGFPTPDVRMWVPLAISAADLSERGDHAFSIVGRLRPGVTLATAETELSAQVTRFTADPLFNFHEWHPAYLRPLRAQIVGDVSRTLWTMLGAVALVLVIACANVANLLLVRAEERAREMSLRTALGAGRRRLVSQLLTESLVMAGAGGAAGVAVAYFGVDALRAVAPANLPRVDEIHVDAAVLAFTLILTVGAGIAFGLIPALHAFRADLQGVLREEGRGGTAGRRRVQVRQLLVVGQTALAVVLLVGAGLLLQSFRRLMTVDPGYQTEGVLTARITIPEVKYQGGDVVAFYESLLPRIAALPGVNVVGAVRTAPLAGVAGVRDVEVDGWVQPVDAGFPVADVQAVTPGYFGAMEIPTLEGRAFGEGDRMDAPLVAMVSEALARHYWPRRSAIGGRIRLDVDGDAYSEVIGVVADVRQEGLDRPAARGTLYFAHAQTPLTWAQDLVTMTLTVRTSIEPTSLVSAIRTEVQALDPSVPVYEARTMEQAVAEATATQRFSMLLQLLFALVALSLSAVGLYGVLAFTVARRRAEIGIRMALGARRSEVQRMVVRQGMGIVAIAIALGVSGALATGWILESLLFGVSARDPLTYGTVVGVLVVVALLACWIPARRASWVDPSEALRGE